MNEYLTYNKECGFNIVTARNSIEAEDIDTVVLDNVEDVDSEIIERIRELIEDD